MKKTQITIELMQNRQMLPIDEVDKKLKNSWLSLTGNLISFWDAMDFIDTFFEVLF